MATLEARSVLSRTHSAPLPARGFFTPSVVPPRARVSFQAQCALPTNSMGRRQATMPAPCRLHIPALPRPPLTRRAVVVKASWGAPVEFTPAKVLSNKLAAPGMHTLLVDVGSTIASGYTKPGQYIQAKTASDAKAGFFAIASGPDPNNQGVIELLIKVQPGAAAETLCGLKEGAELLVSPVQGKGFPVDRIPADAFPTVLMFATGSGISPIKAVIESGVLDVDKRKQVKLYYGTRSPESTAYQSLIPQWAKQGIEVVQVHSGGNKKYVQSVFEKDVEQLSHPGQVGILLCGQKDMCTAVTDLAKKKGVEQIMLNF